MRFSKLRCDYMENPVGFDFDRPVFGWLTEDAGEAQAQTAYQLQFAFDPAFARMARDTGWVPSDACACVEADFPLLPRTRYFWRVRIRTDRAEESAWSDAAFFETARYGEKWTAKWIGSRQIEYPQMRKAFTLSGAGIRRARVYATAAGMYCLFCNGKRVGEDVLAPFINAYDKWLQYETYDVTALLRAGENALGVWLGNGYYKGRVNWPGIPERRGLYGTQLAFLAELIVEYEDGTAETIATDGTWRVSPSPLLRSEIYDGEYFDARRLLPGWSEANLNESGWDAAECVEPPRGALSARRSVPVKVCDTRACQQVIRTPKGEWVLDFGQNLTGWVRMRLRAPEGAEILLQAGEMLDKHGNFYRENMRTALAETRYVCRGGGEEYAPFMTFFGFRYMRVTGLGEVRKEDFTAEIVHSEMERTGEFECSDPRVNQLYSNAYWSQQDNFLDVPTDCPQRDERMGWTGDAQVFSATACMNMEADAFYRKFLYDLALEQKAHGYVPPVVPHFVYGTGLWDFTTTGWGDVATILPWNLYLYFGDRAILARQYDSMKKWVETMRAQDKTGENLYRGLHLGDWLAQDTRDPYNNFGATPTDLIASAYYAVSTRIVSKAARILGIDGDAEEYETLYQNIRAAFRREFFTGGGRVVSETQTALALVLHFGLCEPSEREGLAKRLSDRIYTDNMRLTTGFLGTPVLCPALSESGMNVYAYRLLLSTGCPSWLYAVERGATTIWERWNGLDENGDFGPVSMNSFNHYAYGAIVEWMYRYLCGIQPVEEAPGFKKIRIAPQPNRLLSHASASIRTQYGTVSSAWRLEGDTLTVSVTVPFNATAEIALPDAQSAQITENGKAVPCSGVFTRGPGRWVYRYAPSGETVFAEVADREKMAI